mgnify:CR=1 FL=1
MNILLIGSTGFVGSNFLQYAISKTNYNFICLTRKVKKLDHNIQPAPHWLYNGRSLKEIYDETYETL